MGVWDTTTPAGSQALALGDDRIREFKTAVQEALRGQAAEGVEAVFPGSAPSTAPVFRYRGLKGTTGARPAAGQYGLYVNTTLGTLQRDNGAGWDDVATLIPAGTAMVFYQASAPAGFTAVAVNDKFLRVVTAGGTGGTTGGTVAASTSLAHTHNMPHTHDLGNHTHSTPAHSHQSDYDTVGLTNFTHPDTQGVFTSNTDGVVMDSIAPTSSLGATSRAIKSKTKVDGSGTSGTPSSNTSGAASSSVTDSQLGAFAYADIIIATKN